MKMQDPPEDYRDFFIRNPEASRFISNHLQKSGFAVTFVDFATFSKPGYPPNFQEQRVTLLIDVDSSRVPQNKEVWRNARQEIYAYFINTFNVGDIEVELIDQFRVFNPRMHYLAPDNPDVVAFNGVRDTFLRCARGLLRENLQAATMFLVQPNVQAEREKWQVSVVLYVTPRTVHDWASTTVILASIIALAAGHDKIGVIFIPGAIGALTDGPEMESAEGKSFYGTRESQFPMMGDSIGLVGEGGGGTLGGWMIFETSKAKHWGFLTTSQVAAPSGSQEGTYNRKGVTCNDPENSNLRATVEWMANTDARRSRQVAEEIKAGPGCPEIQVQKLKNDKLIIEAKGKTPLPLLVAELTRAEQRLAQFNRDLELFRNMPKELGKTLFASGRLVDEGRSTLDYAFVEVKAKQLKENAIRDNLLPNHAQLAGHLPEDFRLQQNYAPITGNLRNIGTLQRGDWVFKKGRSTDYTGGRCHGVFMAIFPPAERRQMENGQRGAFGQIDHVDEYLIISAAEERQLHASMNPFAVTGDSGAFVINARGELVAQLFAVDKTFVGGTTQFGHRFGSFVGLVTPIQKIIDSVATLEDGVLRLPDPAREDPDATG